MKNVLLMTVVMLGFCCSCTGKSNTVDSTVWEIDNIKRIQNREPIVLGAPAIIGSPGGKALQFNGEDDGLLLNINPLDGAVEFTVEILFRPDPDGRKEQRFLHIGEADGDRVLIETRLTEDNRWFLDTFIKSGESERTLYAKHFLHPAGEWFHAALVCDGKRMRHFVNGVKELEDSVDYAPMRGGRTSIGCRMNQVYWFKGAVSRVRFTQRVLSPKEFLPM